MADPEKLGGFKVLKEVVLVSPDPFELEGHLPLTLFHLMAENKINLPYVTCILLNSGKWRVNMVVDFRDTRTACRLLAQTLNKRPRRQSNAAILSIFPHRKNPEITGALLEAFGREGIHPDAIAHSPSAISAVVEEEYLLQTSSALFGPFAFGAYRTPADWKLAQKGKERAYKEVVASYQETHPKVYGLEYQDHQELLHLTLAASYMKVLSSAFEGISRNGLDLTFLVASRSQDEAPSMDLCLPLTKRGSNKEIVAHILKPFRVGVTGSVGTFSMNGPHFGDRYGIVRDLLKALEPARIDLLGLSCTIASITGVVPSFQLPETVEAIQKGFDVPSILKTDREYE